MNAYVYAAELLCEECALDVCREIDANGHLRDHEKGDSGFYPQGPYPNGGGEADTPQHCAHCGQFLENPLTDDGIEYVAEAIRDGHGYKPALEMWADFYAPELAPLWERYAEQDDEEAGSRAAEAARAEGWALQADNGAGLFTFFNRVHGYTELVAAADEADAWIGICEVASVGGHDAEADA